MIMTTKKQDFKHFFVIPEVEYLALVKSASNLTISPPSTSSNLPVAASSNLPAELAQSKNLSDRLENEMLQEAEERKEK